MKNEYRIFGFPRGFLFRHASTIRKEKEGATDEEHLLSFPLPYIIDGAHSLNR